MNVPCRRGTGVQGAERTLRTMQRQTVKEWAQQFMRRTPSLEHCTPAPQGEWTQSSPRYTEQDRARRSLFYTQCSAVSRFGERCRRRVLYAYGDKCHVHRDASPEEEKYREV